MEDKLLTGLDAIYVGFEKFNLGSPSSEGTQHVRAVHGLDMLHYKCIMRAAREYKDDVDESLNNSEREGHLHSTEVGEHLHSMSNKELELEAYRILIWYSTNRKEGMEWTAKIEGFCWKVQKLEDQAPSDTNIPYGQPNCPEIISRASVIMWSLLQDITDVGTRAGYALREIKELREEVRELKAVVEAQPKLNIESIIVGDLAKQIVKELCTKSIDSKSQN